VPAALHRQPSARRASLLPNRLFQQRSRRPQYLGPELKCPPLGSWRRTSQLSSISSPSF
jgi:hypothetical protein